MFPWFKQITSAFTRNSDYQQLAPANRAIYRDFLDISWERQLRMIDDDDFCRRALGYTRHTWVKCKNECLRLGLLVIEDGFVVSPMLKDQFNNLPKQVENPEKLSVKIFPKTQQNQQFSPIDKDKDILYPVTDEIEFFPSSTSTTENLDCEIHTTLPETPPEYPEIPLLNGRYMRFGEKTIEGFKSRDRGGFLKDILSDYLNWVVFDAKYKRSKVNTVCNDIHRWIDQAIREKKYGYGC